MCRRNLESWRRELEDILDVAADDSEPWVQMLSELMKTYPSSGEVELNIRVSREHVSFACVQCWVNCEWNFFLKILSRIFFIL